MLLYWNKPSLLNSLCSIRCVLTVRRKRLTTSGKALASPPGHSPKAERWPGTDCLRMLQNYTKTGVISKTPCTFREFVRARLDIRPIQLTSTMTSATVTATDTFNDAVKYALERVGKAGMVLLVCDITATQAVLSGTT